MSDPLRRRSGRGLIGVAEHRPRVPGPSRPAGRRARGASTVEYALLLALVVIVAAFPLGVAIRDVFASYADCVGQSGAPSCGEAPPGGGDGDVGGGPTSPTATGTATPTATPSPTPTQCISPSPDGQLPQECPSPEPDADDSPTAGAT